MKGAFSMSEVFISYTRKDLEYADKLQAYLEDAGIRTWMDRSEIRTGDKWKKEIVGAIERCAAFLILMSPRSSASDWVEKELTLAEDLKKPIFPVLLEGTCFPLLGDIQFENVSGGSYPSNAFLVRLARDLGAKQNSKHRNADLSLLEELWGYINTERINVIADELYTHRLSANRFNHTFGKYLSLRKHYQEKHFISQTLESTFLALDTIMRECNTAVGTCSTRESVNGREVLVPHHKSGHQLNSRGFPTTNVAF